MLRWCVYVNTLKFNDRIGDILYQKSEKSLEISGKKFSLVKKERCLSTILLFLSEREKIISFFYFRLVYSCSGMTQVWKREFRKSTVFKDSFYIEIQSSLPGKCWFISNQIILSTSV